jgi:hypothetical protein
MQITFVDLLFMWLGLKFYFYKSFGMFLSNLKYILHSRKKMSELMTQHQCTTSIDEVINKMDKMLAGQTIIHGRN